MLPLLPMRPVYLEKIWGAERIKSLPGKQAHPPTRPKTGEAWEVADLPEGTSTVSDGPLAGQTLSSLCKAHGPALYGRFHVGGRFPLLVKLVDAADDLSVQVHPDATYAASHAGTYSKDEAWLIVHAEPGSRVLHGFRDGVNARDFQRAIDENHADRLLRTVPTSVGDVVHVPPGTVHAIGPGLLILEVQEPSDTTFRVYDYGRLENGKPRALHVKQAMEVTNFGSQPPVKQTAHRVFSGAGITHDVLVTSRSFSMQRVQLNQGAHFELTLPPETPAVAFVLSGTVSVDKRPFSRGTSVVIPAPIPSIALSAPTEPSTLVVMLPL